VKRARPDISCHTLLEFLMKKSLSAMLKQAPVYRQIREYVHLRRFRRLDENDSQSANFYRQFIAPGDLVFDVGANMGNRSKIFLSLGARVVAFEPQKKCADFLRAALGHEKRFTLVEAALGSADGEAEMMISDAHTISTLSKDWIQTTQSNGRFSQYQWNQKQTVRLTTLDRAIQAYGVPAFIKIDVEGYEKEVLSGLTTPVRCLSIEFAAENIAATFECLDRVNSLSQSAFQFSEGESMGFQLPDWVAAGEIRSWLSALASEDRMAWGDVYIRKAA